MKTNIFNVQLYSLSTDMSSLLFGVEVPFPFGKEVTLNFTTLLDF